MPRKKQLTVGGEKNEVVRDLVEKFNDEHGKGSAKIVSDDGDSFLIEFDSDEKVEELRKFFQGSTNKFISVEPVVNAFGSSTLARLYFEKPVAMEAIQKLREYDEGTTPKGVDVCEGCGSKHAS